MRLRSITGDIQWTEREFNLMNQRAAEAGLTLADWIKSRLFGFSVDNVEEEDRIPIVAPPTAPVTEALEPEPAPEPEVQVIPPRRQRREQNFDGPLGVPAIMELAENLDTARQQIIARAFGATRGAAYNRLISAWYAEHGLAKDQISSGARINLVRLSRSLPTVRAWLDSLPRETPPPRNITVTQLLSAFDRNLVPEWRSAEPELRKTETPAIEEDTIEEAELTAPPEAEAEVETAVVEEAAPEIKPEAAQGPPALAWDPTSKRFVMRPLSSVPLPSQANDQPAEDENEEGVVDFSRIVLDALDPREARIVRRFTERLLMQTASPTIHIEQKSLAAAINKIKSHREKGDTPPTAQLLIRLGVMRGSSGVYKLNQAYLDRIPEIEKWAANAGAVAMADAGDC